MNIPVCVILSLIIILSIVLVFIYTKSEPFYVPPSMVGAGDFHIQQPGAIADQGSFSNDMYNYIEGQGQI